MQTIEQLEKAAEQAKKAAADAAEALRLGRQAEAGKHYGDTLKTVLAYGEHFTTEQKKQLAKALGVSSQAPAKKAAKKADKLPGGKKDEPAPAFYQLDTGESCAEKGKFRAEWADALNAAIAKAGGREKLPRYPNPKAPKAAAAAATK